MNLKHKIISQIILHLISEMEADYQISAANIIIFYQKLQLQAELCNTTTCIRASCKNWAIINTALLQNAFVLAQ